VQNNSHYPGRLTLKGIAPRLNPFLLPSETTIRFVLLIAAILTASLLISNILGPRFFVPDLKSVASECKKNAILKIDQKRTYTDSEEQKILEDFKIATAKCMVPYYQALILWKISGVLLVLGLAALLYWFFPIWRLWFEKLVPLDAEDPPEIFTYVQDLCLEIGFVRAPRFVWSKLNPGRNARAFGRLGRYYVTLPNGLITTFYHDKQTFRSILLHELAHLRNGDVSKGYFTLALGWAFQIELLLFILLDGKAMIQYPTLFATILISSLLLSVFVTLRCNAVIRVRELYADVRASVWDTLPSSLAKILETPNSPKGIWQRLRQVHPDTDERQKVLNETHRLLYIDKWEFLAVGIIIGLAIIPALELFQAFLQVLAVYTGLFSLLEMDEWVTALVFAPFIVGIVGLCIWRETFAKLIRNEKPRNILQVSTYLGLGIGLGMFFPFNEASFFFQLVLGTNTNFLLLFLSTIVWTVFLSLFLLLFVKLINVHAQMWLQIAIASRSPRSLHLTCIVGLGVASFVLYVGFAEYLYIYEMILSNTFNIALSQGVLLSFMSDPPVTFVIALSLAWPLATWFWQNRITGVPLSVHWGFLDRTPLVIIFLVHHRIRPRFAFFVGLSGALIYWILSILYEKIDIPALGSQFHKEYAWIAFALFLQIVVAVVVATKMERSGLLHGLFAAFITGFFIALRIMWRRMLHGDTDGIAGALINVINDGVAFVLPMAYEVTLFATWIRKSRNSFLWGKVVLATGLLYYSFLLLIWLWRQLMYPENFVRASDFWLVASRGHIAMAFFLQAVSIGIIASHVKRLHIIQGLLAAFINTGIMTLGLVLSSFIGTHIPFAFFLVILGGTSGIGVITTLLAVFYISVYQKRLHNRMDLTHITLPLEEMPLRTRSISTPEGKK
jgi:hypothetical protein